jgi:hypothetical protein
LKNVLNTFVILIARKGINTGAMRWKLKRGHPFTQKWEVYIKYLLLPSMWCQVIDEENTSKWNFT